MREYIKEWLNNGNYFYIESKEEFLSFRETCKDFGYVWRVGSQGDILLPQYWPVEVLLVSRLVVFWTNPRRVFDYLDQQSVKWVDVIRKTGSSFSY